MNIRTCKSIWRDKKKKREKNEKEILNNKTNIERGQKSAGKFRSFFARTKIHIYKNIIIAFTSTIVMI